MFKWFLNFLEKNGRKLVIYDKGIPYLSRYYVAFKDRVDGERTDIPGNIFVHHFHRSDSPVYHDHPFSYMTIILKGGYWEHKPDKFGNDVKTWRGPGSVVFSNRDSMMPITRDKTFNLPDVSIPKNTHWVELPENTETWTLFIRGRKYNDELGRDDWGFYPDVFKPRVWWKDWINMQKTD